MQIARQRKRKGLTIHADELERMENALKAALKVLDPLLESLGSVAVST